MEIQNVLSFVKILEKKLEPRYDDHTLRNQCAWWMLEAITGKKEAELIAEAQISLDEKQIATLDIWIVRLVEEKMPLQYILGSVPFVNLDILVEPPVLIPRPETEELCYNVIEKLKKLEHKKITILDIGTGTGCIALSLAKALPYATIYATDVSDEALSLAAKNAIHNNIKHVTYIKSDVYKQISKEITCDFIISNPPYIAQDEWQMLDESVTEWEDPTALIAEDDGLAIIKKIISGAKRILHTNKEMQDKKFPQLIMEIGYKQKEDVIKLLEDAGFSDIKVEKDLEGKDRFVSGRVLDVAILETNT